MMYDFFHFEMPLYIPMVVIANPLEPSLPTVIAKLVFAAGIKTTNASRRWKDKC